MERALRQVLITRAEPDASDTAAKVEARGLHPVVAPIFAVATRPLARLASERVSAVVLTSRNAIGACLPCLLSKPVFAVGRATAKRAEEAGFQHVVHGDGDAQALAKVIAGVHPRTPGSLFLPTAPRQGEQLADALRKQGFRVIRRLAYEIIKLPDLPLTAVTALGGGQVAFALFFSTESADHAVNLIEAAGLGEAVRNVEAVAISERPIMALKRLPWRRVSVAAKPNQDAMLALLQ